MNSLPHVFADEPEECTGCPKLDGDPRACKRCSECGSLIRPRKMEYPCPARRGRMQAEEREAQRRSFAFGNASLSNPNVTREVVDEAAEKIEDES